MLSPNNVYSNARVMMKIIIDWSRMGRPIEPVPGSHLNHIRIYRSIDIYEEKYRDNYINKQCIFEARKKCRFLSCLVSSGIKNTAN